MAAGLGAESNNNTDPQNQKTLADFDPQKKPKRNLYASGAAILASMTSILLGYGKLTLQEPFLVSMSLLYIVIHETCIMEMEVIKFLWEQNQSSQKVDKFCVGDSQFNRKNLFKLV